MRLSQNERRERVKYPQESLPPNGDLVAFARLFVTGVQSGKLTGDALCFGKDVLRKIS